MGKPNRIFIDLRTLAPGSLEDSLATLMAEQLVAQDVDLADETQIILALTGKHDPLMIDRLFDHVIERARIAKQARVDIGDLIGTAALFLLIPVIGVATLIGGFCA